MLATVRTFALVGVEARPVTVEVDVRQGLPSFAIVGLPDAAVRESRERARAAIANAGHKFPMSRITANLAPADLRKAGPAYDLALAAALLAACGELGGGGLAGVAVAGELALDGAVRPVAGALAMAECAARLGLEALAVPRANAAEAALAGGPRIVPIACLADLARIGTDEEPSLTEIEAGPPSVNGSGPLRAAGPDLCDLRGQPVLARALELAAAGGHSVLVTGPPGSGKSLAARCLPSILPPLDRAERIEATRIAGACGLPVPPGGVVRRPFRAPHHTISAAGLVGGGSPPRPGELTLAHRGVLFLDELGEFSRQALEALRQPLEEGTVTIVRVRGSVELPCRVSLIAAANPCPCGNGADSEHCRCSPAAARAYGSRLSHALADRIDIALRVGQPGAEAMAGPPGERSEAVLARVVAARKRQAARLGPGRTNAEMTVDQTRQACRATAGAREALKAGHARLGLSGRGHDRALRVARTIADLEGSADVEEPHVLEALQLRRRGQGS